MRQSVKRKRCPNGTRKEPKTKECVKVNNKKSSKKIKFKKVSKNSQKPSAKQIARAKIMRDEFLKLSKVYQEFKSEQITKKQLAKKINSSNLKLTKANLKSIKVKNQKK